jgi:hypothetical protein
LKLLLLFRLVSQKVLNLFIDVLDVLLDVFDLLQRDGLVLLALNES